MKQEVIQCKGMVERGLNANYLMITDLSRDLKVDGKPMKDIVFTFNEQINFCKAKYMIFKTEFLSMKLGSKV